MTILKHPQRRMNRQQSAPYQYSSAAPNYWGQGNQPVKTSPNWEKKQAQQYRRRRKILFSFYCKIGFSVGLLALSSLIFLSNYITIGAKQSELVAISEEIREVQSDIAFTEAKIAQALNISAIEETAKKQLEMNKPLPHQIEYIEFK